MPGGGREDTGGGDGARSRLSGAASESLDEDESLSEGQ